VLPCNNTAIRRFCLIKRNACRRAVLADAMTALILPAMSETDDLARRFFALWSEYLTALVSDPKTSEPVRRWFALGLAAVAGSPPNVMPGDALRGAPSRSPTDATPAASASGERDAAVAELARRVDELAERLAALERTRDDARGDPRGGGGRTAGGIRRRSRPARP
jgi:hypothetical protein